MSILHRLPRDLRFLIASYNPDLRRLRTAACMMLHELNLEPEVLYDWDRLRSLLLAASEMYFACENIGRGHILHHVVRSQSTVLVNYCLEHHILTLAQIQTEELQKKKKKEKKLVSYLRT